MPINIRPSGGKGFKAGPADNIFGDTSGDIRDVPLMVTPASSRTSSESVRDSYFTTNTSKLSTYDAAGNEVLGIILYYNDGTDNVLTPQTRVNGVWIDNTAILVVQGLPGSGTDFSHISDNHVPAIGSGPNKIPYDSGIRVTEDRLVTPKDLQVGLATISLGLGDIPTHKMSSIGQNVAFANAITGKVFTPGGWSDGVARGAWRSYNRVGGEYHERYVVSSDSSVTLENPRYVSPISSNRRDYAVYYNAAAAISGCTITIYRGGDAEFRTKKFDLVLGENMIDFSVGSGGQGFFDLEGGVEYTVEISSTEGDVLLFGSAAGIPRMLVDWQDWSDEEQANVVYVDSAIQSLRSPSFVSFHSTDRGIVYGGFANTGLIRRRVLATNSDTFVRSNVEVPVVDPSTWTDWQNRETLTYGDI